MPDIFATNKYDDKIAVNNGDKRYTYSELKKLIASEIFYITDKKRNVVITEENNFDFIIQFLASIFCKKNIYLISDRKRLNTLDLEYDILDTNTKTDINDYKFPEINPKEIIINFYTSGSSDKPKNIKKSLYNLICEAEDIGKEFNLKNKNLTFVSTTTMTHLFGMTFHLMTPLYNGQIIGTKTVSYPENVEKENTVLVTTPTFLSAIPKFEVPFKIPPEYIISAGSKLDEKIFEKLEKQSKIIEIYGSTETGVIAHKTHYSDDFKLFKNVKLKINADNAEVESEYFYESKIAINDRVELNNNLLKIKNRTDRLFKIYDKRVNADELEQNLKLCEFVKNCYILKHSDKLACLCALSKSGQEYLLKNNITNLTKKLKQHLNKYSQIIPQKWKYIDQIPMTKSGKINKDLITGLFDLNLSLPVILDRQLSENRVIYKIFFYRQCNFFKGHFDEFKIVPGVVQLYIAKELANMYFNLSLGQGQIKRIKFSNIIEQDCIVNLKLEHNEKQVYYEYYSDNEKYASGTFLCENIFKGV
ncbi:AMP-binding protein [bacterium]|nr:AMP-binding protein [bacterium]